MLLRVRTFYFYFCILTDESKGNEEKENINFYERGKVPNSKSVLEGKIKCEMIFVLQTFSFVNSKYSVSECVCIITFVLIVAVGDLYFNVTY